MNTTTMKNSIYTIIMLSLLAFGCGEHSHDGHEGHDHGEESHEEEEADSKTEVHLLQNQMDIMGIEMGNFQFLNLSTTVKSNGQLEVPPQNKASLSALLGGRVKSVNVLAGDYVHKGQVLAMLEHPDFIELQEKYLAARVKSGLLEKNFLRKKKLFEENVSSAKDFEKAEAEHLSARALVNGLKAKLQMLDIDIIAIESGEFISAIPVKSLISGFVQVVEINIGMYVQPEQHLFEIVDNAEIHIDLKVYEKDMGKIKNGQKVIFSLTSNPDSVFEGTIFALGKSFENESKAMVVHAEITNKRGNLLPGMYVDARIVTTEERVRALPRGAIVSDGGMNYIFVLDSGPDDGDHHENHDHAGHDHGHEEDHSGEYIFRKVEINTGASDIGFTEVAPVDELAADARIVTKGAFYLLAEMKKGEGGHGHHH